MRQPTATHDTSVTKTWGSVQITASQPVGGYSINTMTATGGTRHDHLSFTTRDRDLYRLAYRTIAEAGLTGAHPDDIHARLQDTLRAEFSRALLTRRPAYAAEIDRLLDALTTPAQAAAESAALADIANTIRTTRDGRPLSPLGELQAEFAATHGRQAA